jgi:hypothetical protein
MLKATTLALQSDDHDVLVNIKRKNIKHDKFAELSRRYEAAGISTYVELIVGLPGETYESFVAGIDRVLDAGQHDSLSIYLCMLLENTEMNRPEHRKEHGIESVRMRALLYHGTPEPGVPEEIQETVIATKEMPEGVLTRAVLYSWMVQALHSFGLTQHIAKEFRSTSLSYAAFYGPLLNWALADENRETLLGYVMRELCDVWKTVKSGASWPTMSPSFGEVMWPPEEFLFLRLAHEATSAVFYRELLGCDFLVDEIGPWRASNLIAEQRALFIPYNNTNSVEYAREAVWYGRKGPGRKLRLRK